MPKLENIILILFFNLFNLDVFAASPNYWNLPSAVSDSNVKVDFEVDTTWHTVHGSTKGISGMVWLADVNDYRSIRAEIHIPVDKFNTSNGSRDRELRKIMDSSIVPEVTFNATGTLSICNPRDLDDGKTCSGLLNGNLKIRYITREIRLPVKLLKDIDGYHISGEIPFSWKAFEVEDPSILVARVSDTVRVKFDCILRKS